MHEAGSRDRAVGTATRYGLDDTGIESRWGQEFSAPVQTGPKAHPAFYIMGTGSFPGVKRLGRDADHPPPSSAEVEGRVQLYICSPSGPSWPVLGRALPLPFTLMCTRQSNNFARTLSWKRRGLWETCAGYTQVVLDNSLFNLVQNMLRYNKYLASYVKDALETYKSHNTSIRYSCLFFKKTETRRYILVRSPHAGHTAMNKLTNRLTDDGWTWQAMQGKGHKCPLL